MGVYGKLDTGPDETLLMVVQDDRGVEIPAASTSSDFKIELAVLLAVSNNANISVTVSPQVQAIMQLVEKELEQHDSCLLYTSRLVVNARRKVSGSYYAASDGAEPLGSVHGLLITVRRIASHAKPCRVCVADANGNVLGWMAEADLQEADG